MMRDKAEEIRIATELAALATAAQRLALQKQVPQQPQYGIGVETTISQR